MNVHQATRPWLEPRDNASELARLLTAGGDERIRPDPATGRNRYATSATPRPDEVFLSSSTASTITSRAYRAVERAWTALSPERFGGTSRIDGWFDDLRARLLALFGVPGGVAVLTASGTEAELIAVAIAKSVLPGPLTNIVISPTETGRGVLRAAAGVHFLDSTPFGGVRQTGQALDGWEAADIETLSVEIRDPDGNLRRPREVDAEARHRAQVALDTGRNVLMHRLETSKTGCSGLAPETAAEIVAQAPGRVVVVVDCCQLRCSRRRVRQFLERGFMVAITGSKFFGGPPFSGALLVPPQIMRGIVELALPAGLADYSSRLDWPRELRAKSSLRWNNDANLGLGLRWVAALEEMDRYYRLPQQLRCRTLAYFERQVRMQSQDIDGLHEIRHPATIPSSDPNGILSFVMTDADGAAWSAAETAAIHRLLREPLAPRSALEGPAERMFHLGQPVVIGPRTALRVCASAPLISDVTERVQSGDAIERAFAAWRQDIDALFAKWRWLMKEATSARDAARPTRRPRRGAR
jgi:hypothetical protein